MNTALLARLRPALRGRILASRTDGHMGLAVAAITVATVSRGTAGTINCSGPDRHGHMRTITVGRREVYELLSDGSSTSQWIENGITHTETLTLSPAATA